MGQVLVVDDDRAIRELLRCVLELEGHEVATASDGQMALAFLTEARQPWVVLMDVMMPRLSGIEVCHALRDARVADAPVVGHLIALMTASMLDDSECPAPARTLIHKPFDVDRITAVVDGLLAELAASELPAAVSAPPALSLELSLAASA